MFLAVLAFVAGILLFQQLPFLPSAHWLWGLPLLVPCWYFCRRWPWLPMLATGFAYAFLHALLTFPAAVPETFLGETVLAEGRIHDLPRRQGERARFLFCAQALQLGERRLLGDWCFRLSWYTEAPELHSGERWRLPLRLRKVIGYRNPGSFDYSGWLFGQGVRYTGYVKGEGERLRSPGGTLDELRQRLSARLDGHIESPAAAAIMRALAVGDRSGMTRHHRDVFAATGTSHLIAISGLHIGLVSGLVYLLGRFLWCRVPALCARWPASVAATVPAILAGAGYAALAGFSLATQRALIMLAVIMTALLLRRHLRPLQALVIALLAVVAWDPLSLQSAGFWLSFGAVGILYLVASRGSGRWSWLWQQFGISLGLMPILIWQQMELSLLSPLVNLFAIPLFSLLVVPGVLLGLLLETTAGQPGTLLLEGTAWLVDGLYRVLEWLSRWNPSLNGHEFPLRLLLGVVFLAGARVLLQGWRYRPVLVFVPLVVVLFPGAGNMTPAPPPNGFEFRLLDVGQGLSAVVRTAHHVLVFDTGPRFASGFNTGDAVLAPYLRTLGVDRVDRLLLSHGDLDHVGGTAGLLQHLEVEEILGGEPERLGLHRPVTRCRRGEQWWWDGVHFELLSPGPLPGPEGNDASCVLRIATGNQALLLTGDIEAGVEQALVESDAAGLRSSVVVAAHHGSSSSSSAGFVNAVSPRYVLFSAGAHNRWGFPRSGVQQRWCDAGAVPLNTAVEGAIGFRFTPSSLEGPFLHARSHRRYWQWQMGTSKNSGCPRGTGRSRYFRSPKWLKMKQTGNHVFALRGGKLPV